MQPSAVQISSFTIYTLRLFSCSMVLSSVFPLCRILRETAMPTRAPTSGVRKASARATDAELMPPPAPRKPRSKRSHEELGPEGDGTQQDKGEICKHLQASDEVQKLREEKEKIVDAWLSQTAHLGAVAKCQAARWAVEKELHEAAEAQRAELSAQLQDMSAAAAKQQASLDAQRLQLQAEFADMAAAVEKKLSSLEDERAQLAAALARQRLQNVLFCATCTRSETASKVAAPQGKQQTQRTGGFEFYAAKKAKLVFQGFRLLIPSFR